MATFVLVHGAWSGGWLWVRVARLLRAEGHEVFTPTMTGLGERSHLLNRDIDLETHVTDIINVLKWERLENVTLVGHSYGGMVATGVADRAHERIGSLIYLDAFLPDNGQSLADLAGADGGEAGMRQRAEEGGDGWLVPPMGRDIEPPEDAAWFAELRVPQPLACFIQKLKLDGNHLKIAKKTFILATQFSPSPFFAIADKVRGKPGWAVEELPTHHITQQSMPEATAELFIKHAA